MDNVTNNGSVEESYAQNYLCEERCNLQFGFQTRYVMFESSVAKQKTYIENRETLQHL